MRARERTGGKKKYNTDDKWQYLWQYSEGQAQNFPAAIAPGTAALESVFSSTAGAATQPRTEQRAKFPLSPETDRRQQQFN